MATREKADDVGADPQGSELLATLRSAWAVVYTATHNFVVDRCFDRSAVIAYFALLSFLPLAVLLVALGAWVLGSEEAAERGTELFLQSVLQRLPASVMTQVRALQHEILSGFTYAVLVLWTASKVLSKIETGLDVVFRVHRRRHWALRKIFAFALVGILSVLLVVSIVISGMMGAVDRFIDSTALAPLRASPLYDALNSFASRYLVPWLLSVGAFAFVYRVIPARAVAVRAALLGGLVAGTLWELLKLAFTYYISNVASYTRTYGALAAIVILLFWVNLSASVLLWGGELTAVIDGARELRSPRLRSREPSSSEEPAPAP